MKALIVSVFALLWLSVNAQQMKNPNEVVTQLFVSTDQQNWEKVTRCFAEKVVLDYSSMNGAPASTLSPDQIVTSWKGILPGFEHTHHQLGNFITNEEANKAQVFCYGTATHYLPNEKGAIWTVVGSYDFELEKTADGAWKISSMTFHFKYQDGNTTLPAKAIENAK